MLRRTKAEVERGIPPKKEIHINVGLTDIQRDLYKKILAAELTKGTSRAVFHNVIMQLRKVCNHPFLFEGVEQKFPQDEENLIRFCGKMKMLDQLLQKLQEAESQVLIFS